MSQFDVKSIYQMESSIFVKTQTKRIYSYNEIEKIVENFLVLEK